MALSPRAQRLLKWFTYLFPLLFLVLLEAALQLVNYGNDYPLFKPVANYPGYYTINPEVGRRYFPSSGVRPTVAVTETFAVSKPPGAFRVFVLGGSSAAGYPYYYNASIAGVMRSMLREYFPDRPIEVINLAMPAVSSYTVRDFALELFDYQPDALVIYSGHNEFYGGLGVGSTESLGRSRTLVNLYLALRPYKTFQLVRDVVFWAGGLFSGGESGAPGGTLMARMAGERQIPFGSPAFFRAAEVFRENIGDVIRAARQQGVPVILGTLVSNVRRQRPFEDVFSEHTDKKEWQKEYLAAQAQYEIGNLETALEKLRACQEIDSLPASPYFVQANIAWQMGDHDAAYRYFYRAKDFDGLRFRAAELINREIRSSANQGAIIAPVKDQFEAQSPGNLPGKNLFLEHLHPNLRGYILLGQVFTKTLLSSNALGPWREPGYSGQEWEERCGVTEVDREAARLRVEYLMQGWPFRDSELPDKATLRKSNPTVIERLAWDFWEDRISWEKMHVEAARYYHQQKDYTRAAREYRALINATPVNPSPYLLLGNLLMEQQRYSQALPYYQKAIALEPSALAYRMLGSIYLLENDADSALPALESALRFNTRDAQTLFLLAQAYAMQEKYLPAKEAIRRVLAIRKDFPQARQLTAYLDKKLAESQ